MRTESKVNQSAMVEAAVSPKKPWNILIFISLNCPMRLLSLTFSQWLAILTQLTWLKMILPRNKIRLLVELLPSSTVECALKNALSQTPICKLCKLFACQPPKWTTTVKQSTITSEETLQVKTNNITKIVCSIQIKWLGQLQWQLKLLTLLDFQAVCNLLDSIPTLLVVISAFLKLVKSSLKQQLSNSRKPSSHMSMEMALPKLLTILSQLGPLLSQVLELHSLLDIFSLLSCAFSEDALSGSPLLHQLYLLLELVFTPTA